MKITKKAFTLAEVLITLVVIGVIASLTVPSLLQNIQQQHLRTQWRGAYSLIDQANKRALADYGGSLKGVFLNNTDLKDKLKSYYSYTKECSPTESSGNCWAQEIYYKDHTSSTWVNMTGIVLNNGMFVRFGSANIYCNSTSYYSSASICAAYEVDVNGFKAPNTIGEDIFYIHVLENRIRPAGVAESTGGMSSCEPHGKGCGALYLKQ